MLTHAQYHQRCPQSTILQHRVGGFSSLVSHSHQATWPFSTHQRHHSQSVFDSGYRSRQPPRGRYVSASFVVSCFAYQLAVLQRFSDRQEADALQQRRDLDRFESRLFAQSGCAFSCHLLSSCCCFQCHFHHLLSGSSMHSSFLTNSEALHQQLDDHLPLRIHC